jgi:ribosomal protein S27AE
LNDAEATRAAILRFLEQHRGKAVCSRCVATRLFDGKSIDVAMRRLEGSSSVSRHHDQCSECGKPRLVMSLSEPSTG